MDKTIGKHDFLEILSTKKALCLEDEDGILSNIVESLELFFGHVVGVKDGLEALDEARRNVYDVFIFDISVPSLDGLDLLKKIRQYDQKTPVIILSAHTEQEYLWRAVELKITRYLSKPYDKTALMKALEYVALEMVEHKPIFDLTSGYSYNFCTKTITYENTTIHLSKSESKLLEYFLKRPNQTISYEHLFDYMWDFEQPSKEALKSIIKELRRKIDNKFIKNLYGVGYVFEI